MEEGSGSSVPWIFPPSFFFLLFRKKACKYFEQGKGTCPFGSKCLYRHAYPDGRLAEPEKPRKQLSSEGTVRVRTLPCLTQDTYQWAFPDSVPGPFPNSSGSQEWGRQKKYNLPSLHVAIYNNKACLLAVFAVLKFSAALGFH